MNKFWTKLKSILPFNKTEGQVEEQKCENCTQFFIDEKGLLLHINNKQIEIFSSKQGKTPLSVIKIKTPNVFQKMILQGKHIPKTNLIAVILIDLRMFIINYKQGTVLKCIKNVNMISQFSDQSLLLFGTNQIRSICKRTFKVINQVSTSFSSPVFTVDVLKNLFVVGSYWDIFLFDKQLQMKESCYRAHCMNVLCVKFINETTIASTSEDYQLILWNIGIEQQQDGTEKYSLTKKMTIHLSYINANTIIPCPYNKFGLLINSNSSVRYIIFNQQLNGESPIEFPNLRYKFYNVQMDRLFDSERQFSIRQLKIDLVNSQIVAVFKDSCKIYTSYFHKNTFESIQAPIEN